MSKVLTSLVTQTMRAVRVYKFGGPEVLTVEDGVAVPTCGEREVLIRVQCAGVNPVDTYIRSGAYARLPQLPYTPGADGAGVVAQTGPKVTGIKIDDRVYFTGMSNSGSAAHLCLVADTFVWPLPDNVTFEQGAAIGVPYFTAYRALFAKAFAKRGQTVLVHGASGAVGLAACQMAAHEGLTVLGTAGTADGMQLVQANGASHVFCHRSSNYIADIMAKTENRGVDVILEMLSNVNLQKDLEILNQNGTVVIIGCRGPVEINPRLTMAKESKIVGVAVAAAKEEDWQKMSAYMTFGLRQGYLRPVIHKTYQLDQIRQAHTDVVDSAQATLGKRILIVRD